MNKEKEKKIQNELIDLYLNLKPRKDSEVKTIKNKIFLYKFIDISNFNF